MDPLQEFVVERGCIDTGNVVQQTHRRYHVGDTIWLPASEGARLQKLGVLAHSRRKTVPAYGGRGTLLFIDGKTGERVNI